MKKFIVVAIIAAMLTPALLYFARANEGTAREKTNNTAEASTAFGNRTVERKTAPDALGSQTSATDFPDINMTDVSYCIGMSFGQSMNAQDIDIDLAAFAEGIQHAFEGTEGRLSEEEMQKIMTSFQMSMMQKEMEASERKAGAASQAGQAFLDENKAKDGITVTESGLQYKVIKSGEGVQPTATDAVTVHYRGTLLDGKIFDSSYERGEPVTLQVDRVIPGWTEALQLMHEGDKWELYVPSHLAYGPRGAGGVIGPNETLVFDVELIKVGSASEDPAEETAEPTQEVG